MVDEMDLEEAFMATHADELRVKSAAAVETPCPVCLEPLAAANTPWLRCVNKHTIRPWTDDEIKIMDRA